MDPIGVIDSSSTFFSEDVPLAQDSQLNAVIVFLGCGLSVALYPTRLFAGVRWMWQLHRQGAGGIVGDEMGLGKTVQVCPTGEAGLTLFVVVSRLLSTVGYFHILNTDKIRLRLDRIQTPTRCQHFLERFTAAT